MKVKKFIAILCLISFLGLDACFAVEDTGMASSAVKSVKIEKKDPKIIKLPNKTEIDRKAFEAKMAADEKEYQKIKALAGNGYLLVRDDEGKIRGKISEEALTDEEKEYKETKDSWIEGYYLFYKTADKMLRANNLDTRNWRFFIDKKTKEVNAFASSANLVTINSSFADTFYDNEDALAYLLGHELSHHILGHAQKYKKASDRIKDLSGAIEVFAVTAPYTLGIGLIFIPPLWIKRAVWYKRIRRCELEADTEGLTLMARAGYGLENANDLQTVLVQLGEHEWSFYDTHPRHKTRIANVNKQIAMLDADALRIEGEKNLYEKPVMKLKRSSDKASIVLIPQKNRGAVYYSKASPQQNLIYKAYEAYLNDDLAQSENLFKEAYKLNKKNYVPCLYISYINEYNYKKTKDEKALKEAKKWADRAYRKNNLDKYTYKQKTDAKNL